MALKSYQPVTPSMRELVLVDRSELWKGKPVKALTEGKRGTGGRNNHGRITAWQRGGGHKQRYRTIDFKPGRGGQMARSAGTYVQLVGRDQGYAQLRLGSGEVRIVRGECMATIGAVSNPDQQNI